MSKIEVNQISSQCGSTLTIGQSGDTVTLACGATQTGFGRTGTVDWDTTAKTASFTAVSGNGYFVNTTSGAITVTLPAGSAGDIVGISDYASTFQTNNVTISPNGTDKINGENSSATLSTQGLAVSLVYVDATRGWKSVTGSDNDTTGASFITATGGTITTCGNCKIHTFTGPGTFCVSSLSNNSANNEVSYLVVAGGGGAGGDEGAGGGGAGGFRENKSPVTPYTASPLNGSTPITVTATAFPITVGGGGSGGTANPDTKGTSGSNSVFSTITSAGGGGGGYGNGPYCVEGTGLFGIPGGSGGGSGGRIGGANSCASKGTGNTPPVSPSQGQPGGAAKTCTSASNDSGGGGGGALVAGSNASNPEGPSGAGGNGAATLINPATGEPSGCTQYYAGGGGGGCNTSNAGSSAGGLGGGAPGRGSAGAGVSGDSNTGGGGGGATSGWCGGAGGSGIVIIRYKYQ
jgi:hypothetical protein